MLVEMPSFSGIGLLEVFATAAVLIVSNLAVWQVCCNYSAHPDHPKLDMTGFELARKAPYRVITGPKLIVALGCMASYLVALALIRGAGDASVPMTTAIVLYVVYLVACLADANKAMKEYMK